MTVLMQTIPQPNGHHTAVTKIASSLPKLEDLIVKYGDSVCISFHIHIVALLPGRTQRDPRALCLANVVAIINDQVHGLC